MPILVDGLAEIGRRLTHRTEPAVIQPETIDVPNLERYLVLMYLLVNLGSLNPNSIENLAKGIKSDVEKGRQRVIGDLVRDISGNKHLFINDPFLNRVSLGYDIEELSIEIDPDQPLLPREDGQPHMLVDSLVGGGPARPLLYDLYLLGSLGLAATETDEANYSHTFYPTNRAVAHTKTLRLLFENLDHKFRRRNSIAVVEQYDQKLIPAG